MKNNPFSKLGKFLMKMGNLRIVIIDDECTYFNEVMLSMANSVGFNRIERYPLIDAKLFKELQEDPPSILILDIKNVVSPEIAKDGFGIATVIHKNTSTYIAITSSHRFHLGDINRDFDYIIENRLLTAVDFIAELERITEDYLRKKLRFYKKIVFRMGFSIAKKFFTPQ